MAQCDPKRFLIGVDISGNSKITGDLEVTGDLIGQEFEQNFNDSSDWVAQVTTPETYTLTVTHSLGTSTPEIETSLTNGVPVLIGPTIESINTISFTVFDTERFAGYIHVRK